MGDTYLSGTFGGTAGYGATNQSGTYTGDNPNSVSGPADGGEPTNSYLAGTFGGNAGYGASKAGSLGAAAGGALGNLLFGNSNSDTSASKNPFSQGWPQLFANALLIVVGLIFIIASLKGGTTTTINIAKGALKSTP